MKFSFEIVPRTYQALTQQYDFVLTLGKSISIINVPDIQRFAVRSWEVGSKINRSEYGFIPHFRAYNFSLKSGDIFKIIEENKLDQVLLISGDPPENIKQAHNTNVLDLIKSVRQKFPKLTIHVGFDAYRNSIKKECNYIFRKIDAGANSLFSQPFYDARMIEIYATHLQELEIFIGLCPVVTKSSMNYWQVKNKIIFPATFKPNYEWNINFANEAISIAQDMGFNIYFMPIKINLKDYFEKINFNPKATEK